MKEFLSSQNIQFAYLDITENMTNLKRFLKYRDNSPEFKEIKESGRVGLPCIVINDGEQIVFDKALLDLDKLREEQGGK